MLVDPVEVEGLAIDEELCAGDVDGADADWERVYVLQQRLICLRLHFHLQSRGEDTHEVLGFTRILSSSPHVQGLA